MKICKDCGKATNSLGYCHNCRIYPTVIEANKERDDCNSYGSYASKSKEIISDDQKRSQKIGKRNAEILNKKLELICPKKEPKVEKSPKKPIRKLNNKKPKNERKKLQNKSKSKTVKNKPKNKTDSIEKLLRKSRAKTAEIKAKNETKIEKNLQRRREKAREKPQ